MRTDPRKRSQKFRCEFHNDHGHKTVKCRVLQNEIEGLVKQGHLTKFFTKKEKQSYMKNRSKEDPPRVASLKITVNIIFRGEDVNKVNFTATKKFVKVSISHEKTLTGENIIHN